MKAAYQLHNKIHVGDIPAPTPGTGQALVRTCACGICASDQHFLHGAEKMVAISREIGGPYGHLDLDRPIVPGHEFVGEIIDYGPGSKRLVKVGRRVTSLPAFKFPTGRVEIVGHSNEYPGGFAEYFLLDENLLMEIPEGLSDDLAVMTEPLAVGLEHARMGRPEKDDVPLVVGCGAIGLAVIAGLKLMGVGPVLAADFAPSRRDLALHMGADVVIDPRELSPYGPVPGLGMRRATLVYECVGRSGMLDLITRSVGRGARIVMGGYCQEPETVFVPCGQMKKLQIIFAGGEEQRDLDLALRSITDGVVDVRPWLGERIGLTGVADAIDAMADPAMPIRTVVDPRLP
jgi:threonine dehydrogenase-like Zn-dependent dehydrogenase